MSSDQWDTQFAGDEELLRLEASADREGFLSIPGNDSTDGNAPDTMRDELCAKVSISGWRLMSVVGRGGSSVVYRAVAEDDDSRTAAIKVLGATLHHKDSLVRFNREIFALRKLDHPHIAKLYQIGVTDSGQPFLVLPLIRGKRIDEYCEHTSATVEERVRLMVQVCDAVDHAHKNQILHRDLKPGNVMVDDTGRPFVTDFGLAKLGEEEAIGLGHTHTGAVMGTLNFLAPEQVFALHDEINEATDIFGLGAILHVLLTGRAPFDFENFIEATTKYFKRLPVRLKSDQHIPEELESICLKCLAPRGSDRYSSAAELANEFNRFLDGRSVATRTRRAMRRLSLLHRQYPGLLRSTGAALVCLVVASCAFFMLWQNSLALNRDLDEKTAQYRKPLEDLLSLVATHEGSPESLPYRTDILLVISDALDAVSDEVADDPELRRVAALVEYKLGQVMHLEGDIDEARERYRRALHHFQVLAKQDPDSLSLQFSLFQSYWRTGEFDAAVATLDELQRIDPENSDYRLAAATMMIEQAGRCMYRWEIERAQELVETADQIAMGYYKTMPGNWHVLRKLGFARQLMARLSIIAGDLDEAQRLIDESMRFYEEFAWHTSAVHSEGFEYLTNIRIAFGLAAFRGQVDEAKLLSRKARDVFAQLGHYDASPFYYYYWSLFLAELDAFHAVYGSTDRALLANQEWLDWLHQWDAHHGTSHDFALCVFQYATSQNTSPSDLENVAVLIDAARTEFSAAFKGLVSARVALRRGDIDLAIELIEDNEINVQSRPDLRRYWEFCQGMKRDLTGDSKPEQPNVTEEERRRLLAILTRFDGTLIDRHIETDWEHWRAKADSRE